MRNIFFYEFLNFRPDGSGAIAFETAKIANVGGAIENKLLAQEARFAFLVYRYTTLDFLAISQFRNIFFILKATIFLLARDIGLPSKPENSSTLGVVLKSVAPV